MTNSLTASLFVVDFSSLLLLPHLPHSLWGLGRCCLTANGVWLNIFTISAAAATANGSLPELISKSQEETLDSNAAPAAPAEVSSGDNGELRNSGAGLPTVADSPVSILSILLPCLMYKCALFSHLLWCTCIILYFVPWHLFPPDINPQQHRCVG